jgi:hypothetical protein
VGRHLGLAQLSIAKNDRELDDPAVDPLDIVHRTHLEPVSLQFQPIPGDLFEHLAAVAAKAPRAIVCLEPEHGSCEKVAPGADPLAYQPPVFGPSPAHVARADDQIRVRDPGQKEGEVARMVREITVHLEDVRIVALQGPPESQNVGCAQPQLARAVQYKDPFPLDGQLIGDLARAIRRIVVHDEQIETALLRLDAIDQGDEIVALVVGRYHNQRSRHSHLSSSAGAMCAWPILHATPCTTCSINSSNCRADRSQE